MARKILVISMMAAAALFLMQTMIFAGGTNPEPGTGCSSADVRFKYIPPPFTGTVTLTFDGSFISVVGDLTQVGNPDCIIIIEANNYKSADSVGWNNLKPVELRQQCLELETHFSFNGCGDEYNSVAYFEAVGVGNLISVNPTMKTARVVGMPLQ